MSFHVLLDKDAAQDISGIAAHYGVSVGLVIRTAIRTYLDGARKVRKT